ERASSRLIDIHRMTALLTQVCGRTMLFARASLAWSAGMLRRPVTSARRVREAPKLPSSRGTSPMGLAGPDGDRRITGHKTGVRVRRVKSEEVDLALDATDNFDAFTKVYLSMSRTMLQRHEHLLSPPMPAGHIILHNRDAACETVFVPKPLENPLRGMLLLLRTRLVVQENAIDHENKWIKLRPSWRLLAHVTRRYRKLHHLGDCPRINPKLSCRLAMA